MRALSLLEISDYKYYAAVRSLHQKGYSDVQTTKGDALDYLKKSSLYLPQTSVQDFYVHQWPTICMYTNTKSSDLFRSTFLFSG